MKIKHYYNSMSIRLILFSVIMAIVILLIFALLTFGSYTTSTRLSDNIFNIFDALCKAGAAQLDDNTREAIDALKILNPNFSSLIKINNKVAYQYNINLENSPVDISFFRAISDIENEPNDDITFSLNYKGSYGSGITTLIYCGDDSLYIEMGGIQDSRSLREIKPIKNYYSSLWSIYKGSFYLFLAIGFLTLGIFILFLMNRSIKRLSQITSNIDITNLEQQLPSDNVPNEIAPLIHSINALLYKLSVYEKRQRLFLGCAAHEIKTPITTLRIRLEELQDNKIKSELIEDTRKLMNLTSQLLDYMSITTQNNLSEIVDIKKCCLSTLNEIRYYCEESNIQIRLIDDNSHGIIVKGNYQLICVAISNLLTNAISFSAPYSSIDLMLDGNDMLKVRDYGPGISEDVIGNIFEPFSKSPPNRNGFGLGLAISYEIFSMHNATILARNADDGGAIIEVKFLDHIHAS
ncbi:sensor histidine kinase [Shewanella sp. GXUN23E]|uniref:sensor histidine kinase n=1 Tax=Shewanella sp. GXUN23E TaxID=3422498 RepID=UPI003D7D923D